MLNVFTSRLFKNLLTVLLCMFTTGIMCAQDATHAERPKNIKIIKEYEDGKGNIVRELQYTHGSMIVTETVILPKPKKIGANMPIRPDTLNKDSLIIYVDKPLSITQKELYDSVINLVQSIGVSDTVHGKVQYVVPAPPKLQMKHMVQHTWTF